MVIKKVIRKDGIVYERNVNDILCDKNITIRVPSSLIEKLKYIAIRKEMKWNTMVRKILEEYINNYVEKEM